jgi:hypothetical protein
MSVSINIKSKRGRLRKHAEIIVGWRKDGATWEEIRTTLMDNFCLCFATANALKKAWASIAPKTGGDEAAVVSNARRSNEDNNSKSDNRLPPVPKTARRGSGFKYDERY